MIINEGVLPYLYFMAHFLFEFTSLIKICIPSLSLRNGRFSSASLCVKIISKFGKLKKKKKNNNRVFNYPFFGLFYLIFTVVLDEEGKKRHRSESTNLGEDNPAQRPDITVLQLFLQQYSQYLVPPKKERNQFFIK